MEDKETVLAVVAFIAGLATNVITEIYRNWRANGDAFFAIKAEIKSNIEAVSKVNSTFSAIKANMESESISHTYLVVLKEGLCGNKVYSANLNRLRRFKSKIGEVVRYYSKIENYNQGYRKYVELIAALNQATKELFMKLDLEENLLPGTIVERTDKIELEIKNIKSEIISEIEILHDLSTEIVRLGQEILN